MAGPRLRLIGTFPPKSVKKFFARAKDLSPAWEAIARAQRLSDAEQFQSSTWFKPGGGTQAWRPVDAFGSSPPPASPLIRTGKLFRAVLGGPGYLKRVGKLELTTGVSGGVVPYASIVRGGARNVVSGQPRRQRVTPRQRRFFAARFGAFLRASTTHLTYHPRPWSVHPKLRSMGVRILGRYVATGKILAVSRGQVRP